MDKRKHHTVTLGRVLVGAPDPAGCSHTRLFVVFLLRREEGYFPEPERRISIARPPSPAAHMTGNAGKPLKTSRKRDTWGMMGSGARHQHQLSAALQQGCRLCKPSNNHSKTLWPVAQTSGKWHQNMLSLHLRASTSTHLQGTGQRPTHLPVGWSFPSGDVTSQRIPDSLCHQALPAVGAGRSSCCSFLLHPGSHRGEKKNSPRIYKKARKIRSPRSFPHSVLSSA